jgi:hypothetical protein
VSTLCRRVMGDEQEDRKVGSGEGGGTIPAVSRLYMGAIGLALVACSATPPAPAVPGTSTPSPVVAAPLLPPPPSAHDLRLANALARVPKIAQRVADLRHLPLKHPVPAAAQGQDEFKRYLDVQVKKELPVEKAAASVRALVRLGLLDKPIDLGKTVEDAMVTQAGAYYDPDTKKFYIVIVPEDEMMLDVMSAHELTHAVDDQYFDLSAYTEDPTHSLSSDAQQARRFVAEGEATLVMIAYQLQVTAAQDLFDPKNRLAAGMISKFAALDPKQVAESVAENPELVAQLGPELKASIEAMSAIPPFILDPLFAAYSKGAGAVEAVREAGGWDAVAALYTNAPESTEQVLHPVEKLITKRDPPVAITFAPVPKPLATWTELDQDVLGELLMAVYFENLHDPNPAAQVTGWGGDRYVAYASGEKVVGLWMTTWDTDKDAERFFNAYAGGLRKRFSLKKEWRLSAGGAIERGVRHPDGTVTAAELSGKDVRIIDGADDALAPALFTWLARSTKNKP